MSNGYTVDSCYKFSEYNRTILYCGHTVLSEHLLASLPGLSLNFLPTSLLRGHMPSSEMSSLLWKVPDFRLVLPFSRNEISSVCLDDFLSSLNCFVGSAAEDCRGQVCCLGEDLFPVLMQIWRRSQQTVKVRLLGGGGTGLEGTFLFFFGKNLCDDSPKNIVNLSLGWSVSKHPVSKSVTWSASQ